MILTAHIRAAAGLLASLPLLACQALPTDSTGGEGWQHGTALSLEPGYCHASVPLSLCAQIWMAYEDLAGFGYDGCHAYGGHLLGALESGLVRYDDELSLATANLSTGVITLGRIVNNGWWEIFYAGSHEAKHVMETRGHLCAWGGPCRPDDIDDAGKDCANQMTGEDRQWISY